MRAIDYTGLRKRESYDEIVEIISDPKDKVKYPNRTASQILNSPYMKGMDDDSLMEMEDQESRLRREKMKQLMVQHIAHETGAPRIQVQAEPNPPEGILQEVQQNAQANDERDRTIESMRGQIASMFEEQDTMRQERTHKIARLAREHHNWGTQIAVPDEMATGRTVGSQAEPEVVMKETQTPSYRQDEEDQKKAEYAQLLEELQREKAAAHQVMRHREARQEQAERFGQHAKVRKVSREARWNAIEGFKSAIGFIPAMLGSSREQREEENRMKAFKKLNEGGWWNDEGNGASSSNQGNGVRGFNMNIHTPRGVKSEGGSMSHRAKSSVKDEMVSVKKKGSQSSRSAGDGMAKPVGGTPHLTPSVSERSFRSVKKKDSQSSGQSQVSGMAKPVGGPRSTPTALRSNASASSGHVGSVGPASTGASRAGSRASKAQTVHSSSGSSSSYTGGIKMKR